jgi:hypothetical protein
LAIGLIVEQPVFTLPLLGAVVYTAVLSLGICYTLQVWAQRHTPPADAALILSLESVFAVLAGALWLWDRRWPEWIYPFASAIDTPLPAPKERFHVGLDWKAPWVRVPAGAHERRFRQFSRESIDGWHRKRGLTR